MYNFKLLINSLPVVVHGETASDIQAVHVEGRAAPHNPVRDNRAHTPRRGDSVTAHARRHIVVVHLCRLAWTEVIDEPVGASTAIL